MNFLKRKLSPKRGAKPPKPPAANNGGSSAAQAAHSSGAHSSGAHAGNGSSPHDNHQPQLSKLPSSLSRMPTRKQRMMLLKHIIHHADALQAQFQPDAAGKGHQGGAIASIGSIPIIGSKADDAAIRKSYDRWQQVLQEGLVPMTVHALGLLESHASFIASPAASPAASPRAATAEASEDSSETNGTNVVITIGQPHDEEDEYFATLEGMDVEIQVMAILARAATLRDVHANPATDALSSDPEDHRESPESEPLDHPTSPTETQAQPDHSNKDQDKDLNENSSTNKNENESEAQIESKNEPQSALEGTTQNIDKNASQSQPKNISRCDSNLGEDGMEQINAVMKCTAMLLFHIVLMASTPKLEPDTQEADTEKGMDVSSSSATSSASVSSKSSSSPPSSSPSLASGYDGRVRHVMKCACVDALTNAILEGVEAHDNRLANDKTPHSEEDASHQGPPDQSLYDIDQYSLWNISSLRFSLDHWEIGKDVTFGTSWEQHMQKKMESPPTAPQASANDTNIGDGATVDVDKVLNELKTEAPPEPLSKDKQAEQQQDSITREEVLQSFIASMATIQLSPSEQDLTHRPEELRSKRYSTARFIATRKFEQIERLIAIDVIRFLMAEERERKLRQREKARQSLIDNPLPNDASNEAHDDSETPSNGATLSSIRMQHIKRGLKIAGVGVTLGTLFAVTGGLAAPALAAGIAGLTTLTGAGTASSAAVLAVLATFKAGAALFGVGGGGIAAYKMKKRTEGLTEFEVRRENIEQFMYAGASEETMKKGIEAMLPQLHTTVCVTGWLRDNDVADFQLAWGIQPTCDVADEDAYRIRQMRRFYSVHNPPLVHLCEEFMRQLQKRQKKKFSWERVWTQLERKYGANPDHMLPVDKPHDQEIALSPVEKEMIESVLNEAKVVVGKQRGFLESNELNFNETDEIAEFLAKVSPKKKSQCTDAEFDSEIQGTSLEHDLCAAVSEEDMTTVGSDSTTEMDDQSEKESTSPLHDGADEAESAKQTPSKPHAGTESEAPTPMSPRDKMLAETEADDDRCPVVWDWTRLYGSDIHTITWESKMLSSLCHIVENMALEVSSQATKAALQYSVIGAIISAVALPSALLTASKLIDDPYQIVVLRADEAGKELAKCLLESDERRPVTLVGFSFGARVIFTCLRELARQQELWEDQVARQSNDTDGAVSQSSFLRKKPTTGPKFEYDREPASLIADVVFIGLPRAIDKSALMACRRVTGGRFVNCYTRNDWLLSLMFLARGGTQTCGTKPIEHVPGVENYDVTKLVESHMKYADAIPSILRLIRFCEP